MWGHLDESPGEAIRPLCGNVFRNRGVVLLALALAASALLIITVACIDDGPHEAAGTSVPELNEGRMLLDDDTPKYTFVFHYDLNGHPSGNYKKDETRESSTEWFNYNVGNSGYSYTGHHFRGWDRNQNATGDKCEAPLHGVLLLKAEGAVTEITFYAIYDTVFVGTFYGEGGLIDGETSWSYSVAVDTEPVYEPTVVWEDEISQDTANGGYYLTTHTFNGWWREQNGGGVQFFKSKDYWYPVFQHETIYAYWTNTTSDLKLYKIAFDANGGACSTTSSEGTTKLPKASWDTEYDYFDNGCTVTYHTFKGWYLDGVYAGKYNTSYVPASDCSLVAEWETRSETYYYYTLTYSTGGGSSVTDSLLESTDNPYWAPVGNDCPTMTGYAFLGWSLSDGGSVDVDTNGSVLVYPGTTTLYAVWEHRSIGLTGAPSGYAVAGSTWSYTPATEASGCSFRASGASWLSTSSKGFSGTPAAAGSYSITITASCSGYDDESQSFTVTVISRLVFLSQPSNGVVSYAA